METVYYRKVGRRYVPMSYYETEVLDAMPEGCHLIVCKAGSKMRRYNIEPEFAGLLAAGLLVRDRITTAIMHASSAYPPDRTVTDEQREAWDNLARAFGKDKYSLSIPSCNTIAEKTIEALQREFDQIIKNPNAREMFDRFLTIHHLTRENDSDKCV